MVTIRVHPHYRNNKEQLDRVCLDIISKQTGKRMIDWYKKYVHLKMFTIQSFYVSNKKISKAQP